MTLAQVWAIIRGAWLSIAMMVIVATGVAWWSSSRLPKVYAAKARVMLNVGNGDPTQFSELKRNTEASYISTEMRLVTDQAAMRDVVTKLGWVNDPTVISTWEASGDTSTVTDWAARRLAGNVTAQQFEDSAIMEIYYEAASIDIAKTVVAVIRTAFIDNELRLRAEAARRASAWNRTEAAKAFATLRAAEAERVAFVKANQIPIDTSNASLEMSALTAARAGSIPRASGSLVPTTSVPMQLLQQRIESLETQIAVLGKERGPADPATLSLIASRDEARRQLARETEFAQAGVDATDAQVVANRTLRNNEYLATRLRLLEQSPLYDRLATMDREIALRERLYLAAEQRADSFDIIAAAPSGARVIGDVIGADDPIFPNTPIAVGLAAAISLPLAIALALFGEMLRRKVRGAEDLAFYGGVPVMAVIKSAPPRRRWFGRLGAFRLRAAAAG